MNHTAELITDPNRHAHAITHAEPHVQHNERVKFIEQNKIEAVAGGGIAFSTICCSDPRHVKRHSLQHADHLNPEEVMQMIAFKAREHAEEHAKVTATVEAIKKIAKSGGVTQDCGCG